MSKTDAQLLDEVETAITTTLKMQQMGNGDKLLQMARLKDLYAIRSDLVARVKSAAGTGGFSINTGIIQRD